MEDENEFGDFEEIEEPSEKKDTGNPAHVPSRIRLPRGKQLAGIVTIRLGGNRMSVKATDGKTRNARVPGRFKRRFWLRPGDAVIIEPWEDDDDKADIVFQYRKNETFLLKKKGVLSGTEEEF